MIKLVIRRVEKSSIAALVYTRKVKFKRCEIRFISSLRTLIPVKVSAYLNDILIAETDNNNLPDIPDEVLSNLRSFEDKLVENFLN